MNVTVNGICRIFLNKPIESRETRITSEMFNDQFGTDYEFYNENHWKIFYGMYLGDDDNMLGWNINDMYKVSLLLIHDELFLKKILSREMGFVRPMREMLYSVVHPKHKDFMGWGSPYLIVNDWKRVYRCCQTGIKDFQEIFREMITKDFPGRIRETYFPWGCEIGEPLNYDTLSSNKDKDE